MQTQRYHVETLPFPYNTHTHTFVYVYIISEYVHLEKGLSLGS